MRSAARQSFAANIAVLSLADVASQTGVTRATLSRIENSKMAPTCGVLLKMMEFFHLDWAELIPAAKPELSPKFLSVSTERTGAILTLKSSRRTYSHGETVGLPLVPVIVEISAKRQKNFILLGHNSVELCYVLKGVLRFHVKDRKAPSLKEGVSVLFDGRTPHAYTSGGPGAVRILIVSTRGGLRTPLPLDEYGRLAGFRHGAQLQN